MVDQSLNAAMVGELEEAPKLLTRCRGEIALWDAVIALATNISSDLRIAIPFDPAWFDADSNVTPEAVYSAQLVERKEEESDTAHQQRVTTFAQYHRPDLARYGF